LSENTIGVCSESPVDNYSIKSIKWLKYISLTQNINIRHACNGGEQAIRVNGKTYKLDGYCNETNTLSISISISWLLFSWLQKLLQRTKY